MLQNVEIIGNIVADAEPKVSKSGREFISFKVAVNDGFSEERTATFYDVSYVKSEVLQYLKKGQSVYVSGRLSISAVLKGDKAFLNASVFADHVELCGFQKDS